MSQISKRLRWEDKQIPRRGEATFQRDEISRLCRADDADSPGREHVRKTLFGLCNFFDVISRKSICATQLKRLQEEIMLILFELEIFFPPAFFDIMVHLLIHVVEDIVQLGPAFLRSMMPF